MSKLAFCFMAVDNIKQDLLWKDYFETSGLSINGKYEKMANIYIHRINPHKSNDCLREYNVNWNMSCKRGDLDYVITSILLLQEALLCQENDWFLIFSESCIPLYEFNKIYNFLKLRKNSIINTKISKNSKFWKYKYDKIEKKEKIPKNKVIGCIPQGLIFNRNDAQILVNTLYKYIDIIGLNCKYVDELYYSTVLNLEVRNYKFEQYKINYFNWKQPSTNKEDREYPKTYNTINKRVIDPIKSEGFFFMRKVSDRKKIRLLKII